MLCSKCSSVVKPVLAVDIDGTLGNYHDHFTNFCEMYFQRNFRFDYDGSCDFEDYLLLTREEYRAAKLAYRQGGMKRSMTPYMGAAALLQQAVIYEIEVWVATTRPYQRLDNIDPDTRFWMSNNDMLYHSMLYGDDKYEQLDEHVDRDRVLMVIDDLPEQVFRAEAVWGGRAYMVQRKHNREMRDGSFQPRPAKVITLEDALTILPRKHFSWSQHASE